MPALMLALLPRSGLAQKSRPPNFGHAEWFRVSGFVEFTHSVTYAKSFAGLAAHHAKENPAARVVRPRLDSWREKILPGSQRAR